METTKSPSREPPSVSEALLDHAEIARALRETEDAAARRAFLIAILPQTDIDALHAFLKTEAERYFAINSLDAIRLAESLIASAELTDRPEARALGLLSKADSLRILGHFADSAQIYEEARAAFQAHGNEVGWARTFTGWIFALHYLGRGAEALESVSAAYDTLIRNGEQLLAARLDQNTGYICHWLGQYEMALRHYHRAQEAFESLGALGEDGAARAKANRSIILTLYGDFSTALRLFTEARTVNERRGATQIMLKLDVDIADIYVSQGDYTRGLRLYHEAAAALRRKGEHAEAARVALRMIECYLSLNFYTEAVSLAEETVAQFEQYESPTLIARAHYARARAYERLGNHENALAALDAAAHGFSATGLISEFGVATLQRARVQLGELQWQAALESADCARTLFMERGLIVQQTQADLARAWAMLGLGKAETAALIAQAALVRIHEREIRWLAPAGHHILARAATMQGAFTRARAEGLAAIAEIERVQSRLATELRHNFLEDKLQVYHDTIASCFALDDPHQAFSLLERAKSRALVDYLTINPDVRLQVPDESDQELLDELRRLREEHNWLYDRRYGFSIAQTGNETPSDADMRALSTAIHERERRIAQIHERLALHRSQGGEVWNGLLSAPDPPPLPSLDAGTVLLEYYFHGDASAVFVVQDGTLTVLPLTATPKAIRQLLHRWELNLTATAHAVAAGKPLGGLARNARGILELLYQALLAPVFLQVATSDCRQIVIVPYGPTHAVPFHALHDGRQYLIERMEVITCPSSDLLRSCRDRARPTATEARALVMAYSDGGKLPYALEEAAVVRALLPGVCLVEEDATRDALIAAAPHHRVVHLAAHGEARLDNPSFAHLKLADGHLNATDVFNLALDGALVTLSACETGRNAVVGGDELVGLSRGFLFAGATTLVQSLWRVEDASTARLMAHFYRALCAGQFRGAALRDAQLTLLNERSSTGHPFFWGPFQLVGASDVLA